MWKCEKRPALLGEVGGGRALATTRLYPALFSTVEIAWGFCILVPEAVSQQLRTKPSQSVLAGIVGKDATQPCKSPHRGGQVATLGDGGAIPWTELG